MRYCSAQADTQRQGANHILWQGKVYYLMPAYPMLFASGAVVIEEWLAHPRLRWLKPAYAIVLAVWGALLAPVFLPILPPETYLQYSRATGIAQPKIEDRGTNKMPQFFADRLGWQVTDGVGVS